MKVQVLASGSKGNCVYIETNNTKILIDAGINYLRIKKELEKSNIDIDNLDGILISHIHSDHINGLPSITKKMDIPLYIKEELKEELSKIVPNANFFIIDSNELRINDLTINLIAASHDVPAYGFILSDDRASMLYLTDTGYINRKYYEISKNKDLYVIESNHDEKMLMEGSYPYMLKQRVIGDKGHLSNHYTGRFLKNVIGDRTKYIILAHLSEHNNTKELALEQVKEELEDSFDASRILVAKQENETEMVEI